LGLVIGSFTEVLAHSHKRVLDVVDSLANMKPLMYVHKDETYQMGLEYNANGQLPMTERGLLNTKSEIRSCLVSLQQ
jgi:hypothetical protein